MLHFPFFDGVYKLDYLQKLLTMFDAAEAILLGFQHYLVMLGTTVIIPTALVPQMGGGNVRPGNYFDSKIVFFWKRRSMTTSGIYHLLGGES